MPKYPEDMSIPHLERPEIPDHMTWEELEQLPEEIAGQIELWEGRVVWLRRGPGEHQMFTRRMTTSLERWTRKDMADRPERCWVANLETNVFFGKTGKSDFATPDFLVYRCLGPYEDVRASDVVLVGEVLSPSNTPSEIEEKKARYAKAGIPWYWEISLVAGKSAIAMVRAYALQTEPGLLPAGIRPLRSADYLVVGEWEPATADRITIDHPFPIDISWDELDF